MAAVWPWRQKICFETRQSTLCWLCLVAAARGFICNPPPPPQPHPGVKARSENTWFRCYRRCFGSRACPQVCNCVFNYLWLERGKKLRKSFHVFETGINQSRLHRHIGPSHSFLSYVSRIPVAFMDCCRTENHKLLGNNLKTKAATETLHGASGQQGVVSWKGHS